MRTRSSWIPRRSQVWTVAVVCVATVSGCSSSPATSRTGVATTSHLSANCCERTAPRGSTTVAAPLRAPGLAIYGTLDQRDAAAVLSAAKVARSWVERTWPTKVGSAGTVTVRVAGDAAQFEQLRGGPASSGDVVASTTPAGEVILAETVLRTLTAQGRRVVLAHEITHAVLKQTQRTGLPQWVVEGSAEFTAYRFADVPAQAQTPMLARAVRAGDAPSGPPSDGSFSGTSVQLAYQQAHGYMKFLVARYGLNAWRNFVLATISGSDTAFADHFSGASAPNLRAAYAAFLNRTVGG